MVYETMLSPMEKELEEDNFLISLGVYEHDKCDPKNMLQRVLFLDGEDDVFSTRLSYV